MKLALALAAAAVALAQTPAQVQILAEQSRLIAGESLQLTAVVRDGQGDLVRDAAIQWSTTNGNAIATVDAQGRLTARTLGIAIVRAQVPNGPRVETPFQVLPLRIAMSPAQAELAIGGTQQFTLTAFDKDNRPMATPNFDWAVTSVGYDGAPPNRYFEISSPAGTSVTATGRFEGPAYLRAIFTYSLPGAGVPLNMTAQLSAQALVRVTGPRDYNLRTAYSSTRATSTELRYRPSLLWSTPDGSLYFNAALGSVGSGLLRWKDGAITPVLLGGRASTTPGSKVLDFGQHAFDSDGNILAFELTTDGNRVLRGDPRGVLRPLLVNNTPGAGVDYIGGYSLSRHSINRYGQYLFRAGFRDPGTRQFVTGIFRGSVFGIDEVLVSTLDPLPDVPAGNFDIDWASFGINDQVVAYYRVNVPGKSVIYRHDERGRAKLIATGDRVVNSTVLDFIGSPDGAPAQPIFFAPSGETMVGVRLADNRNYLLRYPATPGAAPDTLALSWAGAAVLDHHPERGTLVFGPFDNQLKVVLWKPGVAPETLLSVNQATVAGTAVESVFSGAFGPNGEIYLSLRGANARQIVAQLRPAQRVLFQSGERLAFPVEPVLYAFSGARAGPVQIFTGSSSAPSVSELQAGTLAPKLAVGDVIGRNSIFPGTQPSAYSRTASGQIFTLVPWVGANRDFGIARLRPDGSPEILHPFNLTIDGLEYYMPWRLSANDRGDLLWLTGTARGDSRLVLTRGGQHRAILNNSADSGVRTQIDGLTVVGIDNAALDESGRVLAQVRFRERLNSSLIGWNGESWQRLVTMGETDIGGRRVNGLGILRAAGPHLMAQLYFEGGLASAAAWRNGRMENVVSPAELTPLGYNVNWISAFDVNTRGDVAYVSGYPEGGQGVFVKRGDRTYVVLNSARTLSDGALLLGLNQLELRDDGTLYLLAPNTKSETLLLEALPRF